MSQKRIFRTACEAKEEERRRMSEAIWPSEANAVAHSGLPAVVCYTTSACCMVWLLKSSTTTVQYVVLACCCCVPFKPNLLRSSAGCCKGSFPAVNNQEHACSSSTPLSETTRCTRPVSGLMFLGNPDCPRMRSDCPSLEDQPRCRNEK